VIIAPRKAPARARARMPVLINIQLQGIHTRAARALRQKRLRSLRKHHFHPLFILRSSIMANNTRIPRVASHDARDCETAIFPSLVYTRTRARARTNRARNNDDSFRRPPPRRSPRVFASILISPPPFDSSLPSLCLCVARVSFFFYFFFFSFLFIFSDSRRRVSFTRFARRSPERACDPLEQLGWTRRIGGRRRGFSIALAIVSSL